GRGFLFFHSEGGVRPGHPPQVLEGVVVGDHAAPAVGAEPDLGCLGRRHPASQTRSIIFLSVRYFTILPTSCECSRVVTRIASSVSTTTRFCTPTAATNFLGA